MSHQNAGRHPILVQPVRDEGLAARTSTLFIAEYVVLTVGSRCERSLRGWCPARKIGRETVTYVSNIDKYYLAYEMLAEQRVERERGQGGGQGALRLQLALLAVVTLGTEMKGEAEVEPGVGQFVVGQAGVEPPHAILADIVGGFIPDARITFANEGGREESGNYLVDWSRLAKEFGIEYAGLHTRVLEVLNEVRQQEGLPPVGGR